MEKSTKNYNLLAMIGTAINALTSAIITAFYFLKPSIVHDLSFAWIVVILGLASVFVFISLHQLLKNKHPEISTLLICLLTGANLTLIISQTGGLDSPFAALLLLVIIAAGLYGRIAIAIALTITVNYSIFAVLQNHLKISYIYSHIIQFALMLSAGGLALWIERRTQVKSQNTINTIQTMSSKVGEDQLKAQVLMNSMGEGVIVVNNNRQIELMNPAACLLTGWDAFSSQGLSYLSIMNLKTVDDVSVTTEHDPFSEAWSQNKTIVNDKMILQTKSGHTTALTMTVSPIYNSAQAISGGIALFRDISSEKEVERQRNEFISTASHEMRTPVAAIEGYIALAMNVNIATVDDRARGYLVKAHDSITHLGELFKDLLSITKIEDGKVGGAIEPVEIGSIIRSVVSDMQFNAQKKNLTLLLQSGGMTLGDKDIIPIFTVMANTERLREVTMNLIDNALKYTFQGGLTVDVSGNKDTVTVKITDTGVGIAPENISHLFQKFYRVDSSATRTIGGTGLGLYLCRTIIEFYSGHVWVESEIGKGSSFIYSLPRISNNPILAPKITLPE